MKMKFLAIAALLVLVGAGCASTGSSSQEANGTPSGSVVEEGTLSQQVPAGDGTVEEMVVENTDDAMVSESTTYTFTSGSSVQYVVQKGWVGKAGEEVVGTNTAVTGNTMYDATTGMLSAVSLTVDSQAFTTDAGARDGEVKKLLQGPITISLPSPATIGTGTLATSAAFDLTLNGVTKRVSFSINGTADADALKATGSANIKMSDFGITAPSLLGVYAVDDAMTVRFNLEAAS